MAPTSYEEASAHLLATLPRMRIGEPLASHEIVRLIADFVEGKISDYQMSAWLATITCVGMSIDETEALTRAYMGGGSPINFVGMDCRVVDKHSTGGVGDKVSLVVVPIVAACGVPVVKISGRGLGHTGGTIDKLESIRGLRLDLSSTEVCAIIDKVGMVITGQSADLVPGDRATYRLRNATGSVESIPLIAASIISKKVAVGADGLILDIKTGAGALIQNQAKATHLAETMVELATRFGINCVAVLSDMSQPLGYSVGNALELKEALAVLQGKIIPRLTELCNMLARLMLQVADPYLSDDEASKQVSRALSTGAAYEQFLRWVCVQGGDEQQLIRPKILPTAPQQKMIYAKQSGWIEAIEPRAIGNAALRVSTGHLVQRAVIDHAAGVIFHKRVGDWVEVGDPLVEIHYTEGDIAIAETLIYSAFTLGISCPTTQPIIQKIIKPLRTSVSMANATAD